MQAALIVLVGSWIVYTGLIVYLIARALMALFGRDD